MLLIWNTAFYGLRNLEEYILITLFFSHKYKIPNHMTFNYLEMIS